MQPDYNQFWRNQNDCQAQDAHFYTFFEDSLNQFISANSSSDPADKIITSEQRYQEVTKQA